VPGWAATRPSCRFAGPAGGVGDAGCCGSRRAAPYWWRSPDLRPAGLPAIATFTPAAVRWEASSRAAPYRGRLEHSGSCDMPGITAEFLTTLVEAAHRSHADALVHRPLRPPRTALRGVPPRGRPGLERAFASGVRAVTEALPAVRTALFPYRNSQCFQNVNTPEEWAADGACDPIRTTSSFAHL